MKPTAEIFEKWNEEHAQKHDLDKFYNHPNALFRYIENKRVKKLIDLAGINAEDKVLEVGCGAGHILERINKGNLYGIDISDIQIRRAKERLGEKVMLLKSPGEKTPFESKYFDKVLCSEVIEHVLDPHPLLSEISRIMKDDGILSLSFPNEDLINFTKKLLKYTGLIRFFGSKDNGWDLLEKDNLHEWHLHEFNLRLAKKFLKGIFKIDKISSVPFFFMPYRYVLKLRKM